MKQLSGDFSRDTAELDTRLRVNNSFDLIRKEVQISGGKLVLYYIDGLTKDDSMLRLIQFFYGLKEPMGNASSFLLKCMPYVEAETSGEIEKLIRSVLSGATVILGETFGASAVIVDSRTYPARNTEDPESDKVLQGARDGFVETLIFNTALIRRRIRDPALSFCYYSVGEASHTDICIAYMAGRAEDAYVARVKKLISGLHCDALPMGQQSLAEVILPRGWLNPFPKVRYTERPDTAAAQLLEGNIILLCDTSPLAMILPTSVFDFMQETDDYMLPPLTGCYLRLVRHASFLLSIFFTPLWMIFASHPAWLPDWLSFILPSGEARLPVLAQLLIGEFIIDALKLASLNTPSLLAGSLSAIAGLILGDFAVDVGWMIPEVVLYMAFVAVVSFAQPGIELGFAFKFIRLMMLILSALLDFPGFFIGLGLTFLLLITNRTVAGKRFYLYPLIPFNGPALSRLLLRRKKRDGKRNRASEDVGSHT